MGSTLRILLARSILHTEAEFHAREVNRQEESDMSALYRISFNIEQDKTVPDEVFRRLVSRPCRDLYLRGRLRWLRYNLHDVLVEGPRDKVERYFEYLRVGKSIVGILSMVKRMYITWYVLTEEFYYINLDAKARYREREAARAERYDEDETTTEEEPDVIGPSQDVQGDAEPNESRRRRRRT